jgi:hypothetical protein
MSLTKTKEFYMTTLLSSIKKNAFIKKLTNWIRKPNTQITVVTWLVRIACWSIGVEGGPVITLKVFIVRRLINYYKLIQLQPRELN